MNLNYDQCGHEYYAREPIISRATLHWPDGARAAFAVVVSAEYYEMQPPTSAFTPPNVPGGFGRGPYPDFRVYSARAYGNRVGIFRILDALDHAGVRPTIALDALTAEYCSPLVDHILKRGYEIVAHGQSLNRVISSRMSESEESRYIQTSLDVIESRSGVRPKGWHGPEYGESARTPALLAQHGVRYVLDWPNDEQPISLSTPHGPLVSLPMAVDFDDVYAQVHRKLSLERWRRAVEEGLDRMIMDGEKTGRMLILNLHPWLTGHPFRVTYLEELLQNIAGKSGLWLTTTEEIANWCRSMRAEGRV